MNKKLIITISISLVSIACLKSQTVEELIAKGNTAYNGKAYKDARGYYEMAISKDIRNQWPQATFNLAIVLYQEKKYDDAIRQFLSLQQSSASSGLKEAVSYNLGNCYLEQKNYQAAIDGYKQALKINPENEDARYNLAYAKAILTSHQGTSNTQQQSEQEKNPPETLEQPPLTPEELEQLKNQLAESENQTRENMEKQPVRKKKVKKDW